MRCAELDQLWLNPIMSIGRRVVYVNLADNSINTKTRYNAPLKLPSAGASPWYQPSFSTNSGSLLWCGYSSCSTGCGRTTPLPVASRSHHPSHPDASDPSNPKCLQD